MLQLDYFAGCANWVALFFADIVFRNKKRVAANFKLPNSRCETPRILLATDVYKMGIDNQNILRVWQ